MFPGAVATSFVGERLGRRKSISIGLVVIVIGALLQATSYTRAHLIVAQIIAGFGLGIIDSTMPGFQSVFSPKLSRGLCKQAMVISNGWRVSWW